MFSQTLLPPAKTSASSRASDRPRATKYAARARTATAAAALVSATRTGRGLRRERLGTARERRSLIHHRLSAQLGIGTFRVLGHAPLSDRPNNCRRWNGVIAKTESPIAPASTIARATASLVRSEN